MPSATLVEIPVDAVLVNPDQPRAVFDKTSLAELAASIQEEGLLYPITVEGPHPPTKDIPHEFYILIDGERRLRAVKHLQKRTVQALVREPGQITRNKRALLALVANLQRDDLNPIEEAKAFQRLRDDLGMNITQIARRTGFSMPRINQRLRILDLDAEIQTLIANGNLQKDNRLTEALLTIEDSEKRVKLARSLANRGASIKAGVEACERLNRHIREETIPKGQTPSIRIAAVKAGPMPKLPEYDVFKASGSVPEWALVNGSAKHVCDNCAMRTIASDVVCKECPLAQFITHLTKKTINKD
jgi:ParB family transcriptional regulator, chromosome partitioning protein